MQDNLEKEIPYSFRDDRNEKVVKQILKIIGDYTTINQGKLQNLDTIQRMVDDTFNIQSDGNVRLASSLLFQITNMIVSKMKPLDIQLRSSAPAELATIASEGISYLMKEGGYVDILTDNYSGFRKQLTYGDFFALVGTKDNGLPEYRSIKISQIYFDANATRLRSTDGEAQRCVIIFEYDWDEACKLFPELEKSGTAGEIPVNSNTNTYDGLSQDEDLQDVGKDRRVEIAFYFDITSKPRFTIIGGKGCTILKDVQGDKYPFFLNNDGNKKNFLPVLQWICYPTNEGVLNAGIGHIVYRIALIIQELDNKAIDYMIQNINPLKIINLPKQQAAGFLAKVARAQNQQKEGKHPIVINDFDTTDKQSGMGVMDTIQATPLTQEYERINAILEKLLNWFGFNPNRVLTDATKTATAISIEEENQSEVIQQIQEGNTRTWQMAVEIAIDMIKKNIKDNNDTTLPIEAIDKMNEEIEAKNTKGAGLNKYDALTLGELKKLLNNYKWNVVVNSRTGLAWSNFMSKQFLRSAVNDALVIGDAETAKKLIKQLNRINGVVIGDTAQPVESSGQSPNPAEQQGPAPAVEGGDVMATEIPI